MQDKMTRMPRSELIELIFSCFRRQEHWSLTALREYTQQPVVYLKEVLNEVCTYNKKVPRGLLLQRSVLREDACVRACVLLTSRTGRSAVMPQGEHRSTFELRPEFREEKKKPAADPPA